MSVRRVLLQHSCPTSAIFPRHRSTHTPVPACFAVEIVENDRQESWARDLLATRRVAFCLLRSLAPSLVVPMAMRDPGRRTKIVVAALMLLNACPEPARAQEPLPPASGIWQSGNPSHVLSPKARLQLFASLSRITRLEKLAFAADGRLEMGALAAGHRGSPVARQILREVLASGHIYVLEDHSNSA